MLLHLPWTVPSGSSEKAEHSVHWLLLKPCDPLLLAPRPPLGPKYCHSILDTEDHIKKSTAVSCYPNIFSFFILKCNRLYINKTSSSRLLALISSLTLHLQAALWLKPGLASRTRSYDTRF